MRVKLTSDTENGVINTQFSVKNQFPTKIIEIEKPTYDLEGNHTGTIVKKEKVIDKNAEPQPIWNDVAPADEAKLLSILGRTNISSGLLPPAVRYVSADHKVVAFERPPMYVTIDHAPYNKDLAYTDGAQRFSFNIPIPWTVYVVVFDDFFLPVNTFVFFRNQMLSSLNDYVGLVTLPNFYNDSKLCPPVNPSFNNDNPSIANGLNEAYNMVWNSGFNMDLFDTVKTGIHMGAPFKIMDYNTHSHMIAAWLKSWSQLNIEKVLKVHWPTPSIEHLDGYAGPYITLKEAIHHAEYSTAREMGHGTYVKEFMVNLVGALSI